MIMVGLTQTEVDVRRARGEGNEVAQDHGRSYLQIAQTNLFSFFNNILYIIGIALVMLGQTTDALMSVGLGILNAVISTVQEIRAKRQLDQVALLNQPQVVVYRCGPIFPLNLPLIHSLCPYPLLGAASSWVGRLD